MILSIPKKISENKYLQSCHNANICETYWIEKLQMERGLVCLESNLLSSRENEITFRSLFLFFLYDLLGLVVPIKIKKQIKIN